MATQWTFLRTTSLFVFTLLSGVIFRTAEVQSRDVLARLGVSAQKRKFIFVGPKYFPYEKPLLTQVMNDIFRRHAYFFQKHIIYLKLLREKIKFIMYDG